MTIQPAQVFISYQRSDEVFAWMEWSGAFVGQAEGHLLWSRYHMSTGDLVAAEDRAPGSSQR